MPLIRFRRLVSLSSSLLMVALTAILVRAQPAPPAQPPVPAGLPGFPPSGPVSLPASPSPATSVPLPISAADGTVGPIKFGDITIDSALEMLERWTGRSVLRPAGLPTTSLSFSLNQKLSKEEARQALETLLTMNGVAVTPLGTKFLKVTPLHTARSEAPDFIEGSTLGLMPSGRIAAKLFQLKFLRVSEFMPQLSSLLNPGTGSPPLLFEKANSSLITDTVSNLQRIETLVAQLDQPSLEGLNAKFYKIVNTTASELVTKLQSILSGASATQLGTGTSFQADDRTNQVILISDTRQHAFFDELIANLDSAGESSTRQEVIQLKHAAASEVSTVLASLITGQNRGASQNQANARNASTLASRAAATPPTPANAAGAALAGANVPQQFSPILNVVPDERSNALVISGTVDDLRLVKDIVTQLDVLLAQVRIEVVIAEITLTNAASTGIEALGLTVQANRLVGFSGSTPGIKVSDGKLYDPTTGARDLAATLNLGTTPRKSTTNILSVPNIVTTHNKEANIFVGESRPVISSYQNTPTTGTVGTGYTSNVNYRDIGIRLTVKPLIGNDGSVQLEIKQEVNDILGDVLIDGNAQPIIGSRTTESFVSVGSGEIVVLGGLQRKSLSRSTSRLAGIPIIGDLLGKRSRDNTRTDLVFFLRPYVLTNTPADNKEAMERLKLSPQHDDVQSALEGVLPARK